MSQKIGVGVGILLIKDGKVLLGKRHEDPERLILNYMVREHGLALAVE